MLSRFHGSVHNNIVRYKVSAALTAPLWKYMIVGQSQIIGHTHPVLLLIHLSFSLSLFLNLLARTLLAVLLVRTR